MPCKVSWLLWLLVLILAVPVQAFQQDSKDELTFERDIRPILKVHCLHCHGEAGEVKGGLDVRLRHLLVEGGASGSAIEPGHPDESFLLFRIEDGEMPPGDVAVRPSAAEYEILSRWIAEGARTAREEPEDPADLPAITPEDREFWAFQPIQRNEAPIVQDQVRVRNPVDAFLLKELEAKGLGFAQEADRATLIRRVTFDLTGLPPTPEEIKAFLNDDHPDSYERLVDRLLASPAYGERWARNWLDVAGYADSEGYNDADTVREDAWKYRDYVVQSFNEDKPYDQFLQEQLAGDELVGPIEDDLNPSEIETLVATGFLRMVPDGTGGRNDDQNLARQDVVRETVNQVSTALLGLTVGCAECHDHRYDPILQTDYYRLRAVFEPALDPKNWRDPRRRQISLLTAKEREQAKALEDQAKAVEADLQVQFEEFRDWIFEQELEQIPEDLRSEARLAGLSWQNDRNKVSEAEKELLDTYPGLKVSAAPNILNLFLQKYERGDELQEAIDVNQKAAAAIRARKPKEEFVRALTEEPGKVPTTFLFLRGNPETPGEEVGPGDLLVLGSEKGPLDFPENDPELPTTGRRLAFAKRLTDGQHPLTARVLVNRVWMHHFGRGLVDTPGDFGLAGERPTHPELLDWLASEFIKNGWKLKPLHKLLVTSAAYRQSSTRSEAAEQIDADNRLYGRMSVRRLEAEAIRDAVLSVSGTLDPTLYGPPAPVSLDENNQVVVESTRRSLYAQVRRSTPAYALQVFDAPDLNPNCLARNVSTVAPQSLLLLNSGFLVEQSARFAARLVEEAGPEPRSQVRLAWELAFGLEPTDHDLDTLSEFLDRQSALLLERKVKAAEVEVKALASLCQVLLGSNRFLYVD